MCELQNAKSTLVERAFKFYMLHACKQLNLFEKHTTCRNLTWKTVTKTSMQCSNFYLHNFNAKNIDNIF